LIGKNRWAANPLEFMLPLATDTLKRVSHFVTFCQKLDGVTLAPEMRKPFDVLAEGLLTEKGLLSENSRGDKTPFELFFRAVAELQTSEITLMKRVLGENP
jgi:hypothetical protein